MKKSILAATLLAAIATAGTASATQSRINSVGGGVKQFTFLDDRNIFTLPAELVKYGTWAAIETGAPGYTSFGFHYNFTPTVVLAIYGTSQSIPSIGLGSPDLTVSQFGAFATNGDAGATHKGTVLLGVDLGTARLGFLLSAWGDLKRSIDADEKVTSNEGPLNIKFAAGLGFGTGLGDVDLALHLGLALPTEEAAEEAVHEGVEIDVGFIFRGTFPFSGPHELVPFATLDFNYAKTNDAGDPKTEHSGIHFGMNVGMDIRLNLADGITVQPGIGFGGNVTSRDITRDGDTNTDKISQFIFPFYNLAVDVKVWDWLDIRFGGSQRVYWQWTDGTDINGDPIAATTEAKVDHSISTGVGFNLPAGVSIDIEVSTGWWQRGPNLLTGDNGAFGVNAAISKDW